MVKNQCKKCGKFVNGEHNCPPKITAVCKTCGKEFKSYPSIVGAYCSKECQIPQLQTLRVGVQISTEQIDKARNTRFKNYPNVLCNHAYKDEWGKVKICKEYRKRYRKTCGGHINGTKQRYFCSIINPNYCIDITL